ncbi:MAG: CHAT domain-containing protein [Planctomycetota bacterium]|nr:CHAT domain-containing protein [Planctomycetota bacterium]
MGLSARTAGDHQAAQDAFAEAKAVFEKASDKRARIAHWYEQASKAALADDKGNEAAMLINAGQAYMQAGDAEEGLVKIREGLAFAEKHGARNWQARGGAMLAQILHQMGRYEAAIIEAEKVQPILEELKDGQGGTLAAITLGKARAATGALGIAAEDFKKGLALAQKAKFGAGILHAVSHLAFTYYRLGDLESARPYYEAELKISEANKLDPKRIDDCYTNLCQIYWVLGEFDVLDTMLERGLKRAEAESRDMLGADMRMKQGQLATLEGQVRLGLKQFQAAEKIFREHGQEKRITDAYLNMGGAYARMGRSERAIKYLEQRLDQVPRADLVSTEKRGLRDRARLQIDLAGLHSDLGQFDDALDSIELAKEAAAKAGDAQHVVRATSTEGSLYWKLGAYEHSLALHRRALEGAKKIGDTRSEMVAAGNVAVLMKEMGDLEGAVKATEAVVALAKKRNSVKQQLHALCSLAGLHHLRDKDDEARPFMEQALELATAYGEPFEVLDTRITASVFIADRDERVAELQAIAKEAHKRRASTREVEARQGLVDLHIAAGEFEDALDEAERAALQLEDVLGGLGDAHGAYARGRYALVYQLGALAAAELDQPEDVFSMLEQGRASMLVSALRARDFVDWDALPEELVAAQAQARVAVSRAQERVAKAARRRDLKRRREASAALEVALAEARAAADRVQRAAKGRAQIAFPRVPPLGDIQAVLEEDQAFVVLGFAGTQALAVVVRPDDERVVRLGERNPIESAAANLVLDDPDANGTKALAALTEKLVKPLVLGDGVKEVIISPQGQLAQTPLSLLFKEQRIVMTPSATTYAHLTDAEIETPGTKVLAMGDPFYGTGGSAAVASVYTRSRGVTRSDSRAGGTLAQLPATRPEVKAVGDVLLLGKEANEARFRSAVVAEERWRAVHFACHGLVNPDAADLCALALTPHGEDDGFLTSLELLQMRIPTDLAVLSACETGRGQVKAGVGLMGLARSFIHAGAPRVVCSLWKVDDEATKAFMGKFYELWNPKKGKGIAPAEALKQAQAHVRSQEKWKHPYYWGAWVLWGLPR